MVMQSAEASGLMACRGLDPATVPTVLIRFCNTVDLYCRIQYLPYPSVALNPGGWVPLSRSGNRFKHTKIKVWRARVCQDRFRASFSFGKIHYLPYKVSSGSSISSKTIGQDALFSGPQ